MGYLKGLAVLLPILVSAIVGAVVVLPLGFPLIFFPSVRAVYHAWADLLKKQWFTLVTIMLHNVGGIKLFSYGDVPVDEPALVLSNHRTRIDWMILWGYFLRCPGQRLRELRIVLKKALQKLPVFGWAMATFRFIFLSREWNKDKEQLSLLIKYYKHYKEQSTILIFPEGTDLHKSALAKSVTYAEKNNLPVLKNVLYPRSTGTQFILDSMSDCFEAVWDITIAYKDRVPGERPDEMKLAKGLFPKEVHVHLKRHPMKSFPKGEKGFPEWLTKTFVNKEAILADFNTNHKFEGPRVPIVTSPVAILSCIAYWAVALVYLSVLVSTWYGVLFLFLAITLNVFYGPSQDELLYKSVQN
eukprot:TRINITY_DN4353_c3_g1_i1.p1 TRINITY_DN4353_c3_g1~~TRINITY_DN4353_c3_g1_i1.p1  ORF type:complete len:365 (+),score=33.07 TRINITY_DN4353_c3_g1_i1:30-1097(+)